MLHRFQQFSTAISCLYHDIQKIERVEMAKYALKGPHAQCLLVMAGFPEGITSAELTEQCEKDKAAISRAVAELEEAGLLVRCQRDGLRYRARLVLTPEGHEAAQKVISRVQLAVERAGAGLDEEERTVFYRVLGRIAENLHAVCEDGLE